MEDIEVEEEEDMVEEVEAQSPATIVAGKTFGQRFPITSQGIL